MNLSLKSLFAAVVVLGAVGACGGGPGESTPFPNPTDACEKNEDCNEDAPICDPLRGCVECQFDRDCEAGQRCHDRACVPLKECHSSKTHTSYRATASTGFESFARVDNGYVSTASPRSLSS